MLSEPVRLKVTGNCSQGLPSAKALPIRPLCSLLEPISSMLLASWAGLFFFFLMAVRPSLRIEVC